MPRTSNYRSQALSRSQVAAAIAAHRHADAMGYPLNLSLDIHWAWTRFANGGIWNRRKAVAAFLESQRHWLVNHGTSFFNLLVREAPPSSMEGEHAHQLVHVPDCLQIAFKKHTRDFLRGGQRHQLRALKCPNVYSAGKLAYLLKGCTGPGRELLAAMFKTDYERNRFLEGTQHKTCQGIIYGKRLMISQALGPNARSGTGSTAQFNKTIGLIKAA